MLSIIYTITYVFYFVDIVHYGLDLVLISFSVFNIFFANSLF